MKIKVLDSNGDECYLMPRWQVVVELSERNVASLYHQGQASVNAEEADRPRQVYGSLLKKFQGGPRMVVHVVPDGEHYDEEGIAR